MECPLCKKQISRIRVEKLERSLSQTICNVDGLSKVIEEQGEPCEEIESYYGFMCHEDGCGEELFTVEAYYDSEAVEAWEEFLKEKEGA